MNLYTEIDPVFLSTALRALITQPDEDRDRNQFLLSRWFPAALVGGVEWEWTDKASLRTFTEAMPARAFDAAARIKAREGYQKKSGAMLPFAESYIVRELDMLKQAQAARTDAEIANALSEVFDDITRGFRAYRARMEILYAELIRNGTMTIAENGIQPEAIDFGRSANNARTASTVWSTAATADPFGDEEGCLDVLADEQNLFWNDLVVLCNRATYREYTQIQAVQDAHPSFRVVDRLSDSMVQELRREHSLPPVLVYDASAKGYGGSAAKLIPDGEWIYLPANSPLGATQYGTPVAASMPGLEQVGAEGSGPIAYIQYELDPPMSKTTIDFLGAPVEYDPNATLKLTV